jgi:hypothetical protein
MLGFLHTAVLYGLAAAAIPLLIHLLARPRVKLVPFGSLRFLQTVQRESSRRIRLRRLLLLALRTAAVACLVLAFSRPVSRSAALWTGSGPGRVSAWVADNSFSMRREGAWNQALRAAEDVAGSAADGDRVALVFTVPSRTDPPPDSLLRPDEALRRVRMAEPGWAGAATLPALERAAALPSLRSTPKPEILLLSDLAAASFPPKPGPAGLKAWAGSVFVFPCGRPDDNTAATDARFVPPMLDTDAPTRLSGGVGRFGRDETSDRLVRFFSNGRAVAQNAVRLKAGESWSGSVPLVSGEAGWSRGEIRVEPDAFPDDDIRYACAYIPDRVRILLVEGAAGDATPFALALAPDPDAPSRIAVESFAESQDWPGRLGASDALFLVNPSRLTRGQVRACRAFMEAGGGVFLVPGSRTDLDALNADWFTPLWRDTVSAFPAAGRSAHFTVPSVPSGDPVFEGVFEGRGQPFRPPRLFRAVRLSGPGHRTIAAMTGGSPFLAEYRLGRGGCLFMAAGPDTAWSDLGLHSLFAPLVYRAAARLSGFRSGVTLSALVGDTVTVAVSRIREGVPCRVELPSGERIALLPAVRQGGSTLTLPGAASPGIHSFFAGDSLEALASVNTDPAESDFRALGGAAFSRLLPAADVLILDPSRSAAAQIRSHRIGRDWWRELLLAAVLLLAAEMAVAGRWK